jgi:hypothetical protein
MNDFTKDELIKLARITTLYYSDPTLSPGIFPEDTVLVNKIESMIDNYCEHEWQNTCCGCESVMCSKCNAELRMTE